MFSRSHPVLISVLVLVSFRLTALDDKAKNPAPDPDLAAADQLYRAGKFAEAETSYQAILQKDTKLVPAQVGLVRSMLKQQKIDESLESVNKALTLMPDSAALLAAKGDVQFRRAEMSDAEASYLAAKKLDPKEVRTYLGLARLYGASSLYRQAYDQLRIAHEIAPDDVEVRKAWLRMLPRTERLAALTAYLSGPHPDDDEETMHMQEALDFLKATIDKPAHACKLVSKVEKTETNFEIMYTPDARHMRGIGLSVRLNDQYVRLLLDTGGSGIIVSHKIAEKADLTRISTRHFGGLGDHGMQSGYSALADHIRVGDLEFQDCIVSVLDSDSVVDQDGLIGANVFAKYLVDLDLPEMRLKLSPLPKRPDETVTPKSLNSEGEEQAAPEQKQSGTDASASSASKSGPVRPTPETHLPRDRYIAPEMTYWTKMFRIGHLVLLPTSVNFSDPVLFGLDTGSAVNILSARAQKDIEKFSPEIHAPLSGLSGEVNRGYFTKATLTFGYSRWSVGMLAIDLSSQSRRVGTEVSGLLGFGMLRRFEIRLDYRDGLIDFVYDPTRQPLLAQNPTPTLEKKDSSTTPFVSQHPLPQPESPNPFSTSGQASTLDILSDTQGVDFASYLDGVVRTIKKKWDHLILTSARPPTLRKAMAAVEFSILRDGTVSETRLQDGGSSGDADLDNAALNSITASNPFPPLPNEFSGQYLALRFHFCYNATEADSTIDRIDRKR